MLTLVCLAFVPVIILTTKVMMSIFTDKHADEEQKSFEEAGKSRVLKWQSYKNIKKFIFSN